VRDDDIPVLVADGVCDVGIIGKNVLVEKELELGGNKKSRQEFQILKALGFGSCRLSLAIPNTKQFIDLNSLNNLKIATSYPYILKKFLIENNILAEIVNLSGSVEIAPRLKVADLICDLIATGEILQANNLKELAEVMASEAILFRSRALESQREEILQMLLQRIDAVLEVKESKYIMFHLQKIKSTLLKVF
jgi:ATP phosphoribosyltransferase